MRTIPATATAAPASVYPFDRERIASLFAAFASGSVFFGKILLTLPLFGLAAVVFALHLVLPSEEHW